MFDLLKNLVKSSEEKQQEVMAAYLDDALTPHQRRDFEQRLERDDDLQAELAQQRWLKQQLRQLPRRPVPRNFTLDPAAYGTPQREPLLQLYPALRVATVLTAFLFILALAIDLFLPQGGTSLLSGVGQDVAMVAEEAAEAPAAPAEVSVAEEVVEVTRVVTEVVVEGESVEVEVVVEAEEEQALEEEAIEELAMAEEVQRTEVAAEPASEAVTEPESAEAVADEEPSLFANGELGASEEDMTPKATPAPQLTDAIQNTPTALPTATVSVPPRPETESEEGDRSVALAPTIADDEQEPDTITPPRPAPTGESQPREPAGAYLVGGLRLLQIALGVILIVLTLATILIRRRV